MHLSYTVSVVSAYFLSLGIPDEEASELHHRYYTQYGLALRGLTRHHNVGEASPFRCGSTIQLSTGFPWLADPLDFDAKCDCSLPLEQMIKPDPALKQLFRDIDRSTVRVWALTNAYRTVRFFPFSLQHDRLPVFTVTLGLL